MTKTDLTARRDLAVRELRARLAVDQERLAATVRRLDAVVTGSADDVDRALAELLLERYRSGHLDALLPMYETRAWWHLGALSWAAFCRDELGMSRSRAYQLVGLGNVHRVLTAAGLDHVDELTEAQARPLVPLLGAPDALRSAWRRACNLTDGRPPTADDVERAVHLEAVPAP